MSQIKISFVGFTEGLAPFGRQPIFKLASTHNGVVILERLLSTGELDRLGFEVPEAEQRRLVDAMHTWNNSGLADDHLFPVVGGSK